MRELKAIAVHDLGQTESQFWDMALFDFYALLDRYTHAEKRLDQRTALIAMILANANRDTKKRREPFTLEDFMPKAAEQVLGTEGAPADPVELEKWAAAKRDQVRATFGAWAGQAKNLKPGKVQRVKRR